MDIFVLTSEEYSVKSMDIKATGLSEISILGKITLIFNLFANLSSWISFTTTSWGEGYENDSRLGVGLWKICGTSLQTPCLDTAGVRIDWYASVQAFSIFGFVGSNISVALILIYIFWHRFKKNTKLAMAAGIICILSSAAYLLAVIIFASMFKDLGMHTLSWSFIFTVIALLLETLVGCALLIDARNFM
ncbi:hypothetical protein LOTGIDRAFT_161343 [Lottia gigantea]|uniref:Uncharacterized protein n=1 Tax=Lottia gigantea TaxID=225164 RepID=V3ZRU1_LOTGI|nr:hypothetical protein LOTGIDRAFT_161343 [Lottia gigantea]ESO94143.1 hypothetical protein LOTGIDRAFT_161343 [Lottia gigantea]